MRIPVLVFAVLALAALPAPAADKSPVPVVPAFDAPPPPPPPPDKAEASSVPAPDEEVRITTQGTEIHEEHRVNGKLYMIKVTPAKGKPYYLIDREGSGQFKRSEFESDIAVPMWVIKRF
jgi:hypothetical protein